MTAEQPHTSDEAVEEVATRDELTTYAGMLDLAEELGLDPARLRGEEGAALFGDREVFHSGRIDDFDLGVKTFGRVDDYHVAEFQRWNLVRLLQLPPRVGEDWAEGRYVCAGRFVRLARFGYVSEILLPLLFAAVLAVIALAAALLSPAAARGQMLPDGFGPGPSSGIGLTSENGFAGPAMRKLKNVAVAGGFLVLVLLTATLVSGVMVTGSRGGFLIGGFLGRRPADRGGGRPRG